MLKNHKNGGSLFVKIPHFKSDPTLFLLRIFKKYKKSQMWHPDLGVSIGPIFMIIGGHNGELDRSPNFFVSLVKQEFSECRSIFSPNNHFIFWDFARSEKLTYTKIQISRKLDVKIKKKKKVE